jgi:steroid 5-alpha reductase family enzyme
MLEQYFIPQFWNRFPKEPTSVEWITVPLIIGVLYTLPAYNVFCRKDRVVDISPAMTMVCIMMFTLGCLINTTSDVYMHAVKEAMAPQKVLITKGLHRLCQNPNWFGDYLRYTSFCLSSGKASSFIVLALVMFVNYATTTEPELKGGMRERYGSAYEEWVQNVPNTIVPSFNNNHVLEIVCGVILIWCASYGLGAVGRANVKIKTV